MRRLIALVALIAALALAGCSTPSAEPKPTPTTTELGKITTIDQLVDAAVDAGLVCNWDQTDVVTDAVASGTCSDSSVLMMFENNSDARQRAADIGGVTDGPLLVGENWIVNSDINDELQPKLGGELVGG